MIDETVLAQKILSCVYRLHQRYGVKYVIDVLRGAKTKEIYDRSHDRLSTYDLLSEYTETDLRYYIDALIEKRLLERSEGEYPILRWTDLSPSVTNGTEKVMLRKKPRSSVQKKKGDDLQCNQELFLILSEIRRTLAQTNHVPAFVVFGDRTLIEMCKTYPQTREAMMQINGVGPAKWLKYGQIFLEAIQRYCSKKPAAKTLRNAPAYTPSN